MLGDNVDHPTHRISTPHGASCASKNLNPFDVIDLKVRKIKGIIGITGIVHLDVVDQHQRLVGVGASGKDRDLLPGASGTDHIKTRNDPKHIRHAIESACLNFFGGDHRHRIP